MSKVKITKVASPTDRLRKATLTGPEDQALKAPANEVRWWASAPFNDQMTVGTIIDLEVEKKPGRNEGEIEHWARSVNGVTAEKTKGGNAGARPFSPKSREEIHSPQIATIIVACIENGIEIQDARTWLDVYSTAAASFMNSTAGRQGAS